MALYASKGDDSGSKYGPHPEGQFNAVCIDVVDLGMIESTFDGITKSQHKCQIRFFCGEPDEDGGDKWLTSSRFTVSLHEKANLRRFLKSWRGKDFTEAELKKFDLETLIGVPAFLQVSHAVSKGGNTYASIDTVMRLPKGQQAPEAPYGYVRACDRETAEERAEAEAEGPAPSAKGQSASMAEMDRQLAEPPATPDRWAEEPDDSLPF